MEGISNLKSIVTFPPSLFRKTLISPYINPFRPQEKGVRTWSVGIFGVEIVRVLSIASGFRLDDWAKNLLAILGLEIFMKFQRDWTIERKFVSDFRWNFFWKRLCFFFFLLLDILSFRVCFAWFFLRPVLKNWSIHWLPMSFGLSCFYLRWKSLPTRHRPYSAALRKVHVPFFFIILYFLYGVESWFVVLSTWGIIFRLVV